MGVLKNDVGRPSNKTIKMRRILKGLGLLVVVIGIISIYFVFDNEGKDSSIKTKKSKVLSKYEMKGKLANSIYINSKDALLKYMRAEHDILDWKEFWKHVILQAFQNEYQSLEELEGELNHKCIMVVFLVDGLEEIFQHTISSKNERNAIAALCRDVIDEVKVAYRNLGLIVFLRKDMARDSFTVNY